MNMQLVPLCPRADSSLIESFLLSHGWLWSRDSLNTTLFWLELHEIRCERDFVCLGAIEDIDAASMLEPAVRGFLQKLVMVVLDMVGLLWFSEFCCYVAGCRTQCKKEITL